MSVEHRTRKLFDIIVAYPDSSPAIEDLKVFSAIGDMDEAKVVAQIQLHATRHAWPRLTRNGLSEKRLEMRKLV